MSEQQFREIQLSVKQLVFLFMTSVVLAVAVFLLGVSVGRGVRATAGEMEIADQIANVPPPAELPPATEIVPADTAYHDELLGTATPPAEPEPVAEPVADEPDGPAGDARSSQAVPATPQEARVEAPPLATGPAPQAAAAPAATPSGWFLQIGAYRSQENAARQVADLLSKGYQASRAEPEQAGGLHRVRVGPFADRSDATRVQAQLRAQEGMESSLSR